MPTGGGSLGDLVLDDLLDCGFDGMHPNEVAAGMDLAQRLASAPRAAMAGAKKALVQGLDLDLQQGLEMESRVSNQVFALPRP